MFNSKIIISFFFVVVSLLLVSFFQFNKGFKQIKIVNIYEDVSTLEVTLQMNKKLNILEFNSSDIIDSVLIFNNRGEIIRKEKPISNTINLKELRNKELFISFVSNEKIAFKSLYY